MNCKLMPREIEYIKDGEDFVTGVPRIESRDAWTESSSGYQEPDDRVEEITCVADSEHGPFIWKVTFRAIGFETNQDRDVELISSPNGVEVMGEPQFEFE
ncbi:hypothetical protein ACXJY6_06785 [Vibrio sp. RC27]